MMLNDRVRPEEGGARSPEAEKMNGEGGGGVARGRGEDVTRPRGRNLANRPVGDGLMAEHPINPSNVC